MARKGFTSRYPKSSTFKALKASKILDPDSSEKSDRSAFKASLASKVQATKSSPTKHPHVAVSAGAGTGKTSTMEAAYRASQSQALPFRPTDSQQAVIDRFLQDGDIPTQFLAFNASIAQEFVNRGLPGRTFHSFGNEALRSLGVRFQQPNRFKTNNILEKQFGLKPRGPKSDSELFRLLPRLVSLCKNTLCGLPQFRDDPYARSYPESVPNVSADEIYDLVDHFSLDLSADDLRKCVELVNPVLSSHLDQLRKGILDFDDMIWGPLVLGLSIPRFGRLVVDECQDLNASRMVLARLSGERLYTVGDQCQPTGTKVRLCAGLGKGGFQKHVECDIEDLEVGDKVVSYSVSDCAFLKSGRMVTGITKRAYKGDLIVVHTADGKVSKYTPNHHCLANFKSIEDKYVVYLMRKGSLYRIGKSRLAHDQANVCGPMLRMKAEDADAVWILSYHDDDHSALRWEAAYSAKYGIPQLMFTEKNTSAAFLQSDLDSIWEYIGDLEARVDVLLKDFNLLKRYPLFSTAESLSVKGSWKTQGVKRPRILRACNLVEGCLVLPYADSVHVRKSDWVKIVKIERERYDGYVYSLTVEGEHLYIADGIVTHNCQAIYGFSGADAHAFHAFQEWMRNSSVGVDILPLMETRRCPKAVVELVRHIVPEFRALPEAPEGTIVGIGPYASSAPPVPWDVLTGERSLTSTTPGSGIHPSWLGKTSDEHLTLLPGDMVLSATNAPTVSLAYRLIAQGKRCMIRGRDVGQGLLALLRRAEEKSGVKSIPELISWLEAYEDSEQAKLSASKRPNENALRSLEDRLSCIRLLASRVDNLGELVNLITSLFDTAGRGEEVDHASGKNLILLSTVHKAKGLEANRVFLLRPEHLPPPWAKQDWEQEQALNLQYVAYTRAKQTLVGTLTPSA